MAQPNNGVNAEDKVKVVETIGMEVPKSDNINPDIYYVVSDSERNGVRFLTEACTVDGVGVIQKDTVFAPNGIAITTVMLPKVRIVAIEDENGKRDGYRYIGINVKTLNESGVNDRSRR